jgi:G:T/U-mismatch repair DNA glycosylase
MTEKKIAVEHHPLKPFLPANATVLMLGSFPPPKMRWSMDFYYPNFNNDMWRIFGILFFGNKDHFLNWEKNSFCRDRIVDFLKETGIALYDTAVAVRRQKENASDKFLEVVEATDIAALLRRIPQCRAVVTTGALATDTLCMQISVEKPAMGTHTEFIFERRQMRFYRMPSSSRAYPLSPEKKAEHYRTMFRELHLLP